MSLDSSPPIPSDRSSPEPPHPSQTDASAAAATSAATPTPPLSRSNRPSRACTLRAAARLQQQQQHHHHQQAEPRRPKAARKERQRKLENDESSPPQQCGSASKIVTSLVDPPSPSQLPRWTLRSMWELASVLNFLHAFRPLLNIQAEFSAEELETALLTPNDNLSDIHIPLMKAIPPVTRMALTRDTWITVLCRKLRDWWHWVADGDLPIVASHGAEIEVYKTLDPGVRVIILKALCDIRVEQEDIRNYIDNSLKHGVQLSTFRKERIGGDSQGISYWYEDDPIIGYRLYREIRKTEVKKVRTKGSHVLPCTTYQWETVATNFDEFQDVGEKLFSSINRTEAAVGKKLKGDMLLEIEKVHKRKEKMLKKQHRQALLLDNYVSVDGLGPGRSLRDRKPVTYTFDDYDKSINEAIKITKTKPPSPEPLQKRDVMKHEASSNGKWSGASDSNEHVGFSPLSPKSPDYEEEDDVEEDDTSELMDRSNRRRQRPQRYSAKDFVEAVSDNDADFDSDDEIVGEAIYDEEYLKKRKEMRKFSSSSEGDEEYRWEEENPEEEEEEEEDEDSASASEESDEPRKLKKLRGRPKELPGRTRREAKLRSVDELQSGLRRSKRATRNRIDYRQLEFSDSDTDPMKPERSNASEQHSDATENGDYLMESQDSDVNDGHHEMEDSDVNDGHHDMEVSQADQAVENYPETLEKKESQPPEKSNSPGQNEVGGVQKRRFLDLNELAPGSGFDDGPNTIMKDDGDDL
ncbi:DDT domain-containing protein DDR4 [Argentina anserina]|uniref:DDT domain-containing protein DDR4 n=1 Tax=Argentina anserina TaxID=57926 RepID=UPI00217650C2|nr:DDT domain-containing protein DDR4 [Potentilla anserina]